MRVKLALLMVSLLVLLSLIGTSRATNTTPTPTVKANWWDKLGEPKYGGELKLRLSNFEFTTDSTTMTGAEKMIWWESLFVPDWTVDRDTYSFPSAFVPCEYYAGLLAESWEYKDSQTVTVKIREGIHWQDKPPVNGREVTAEDVQYSYDRLLGKGSGFTEPSPFWIGSLSTIERVVSTGKYTVEFKIKQPGAMAIYQVLGANANSLAVIVPHEWVEYDDKEWQNVIGTGPWILTDLVQGTSLTYSRNPDYWGHDERHPENQIPYLDTLKYVVIADQATALAAMRTGRIDIMNADRAGVMTLQQAESLANTNPEIVQATFPGPGTTLEMRCDTGPFTDIRVRKALNMAINRELIAQTYYGGKVDGKPCGAIAPYLTDYAFTYDEWPQSLKDEYSFNQERAKELLAEAAADGVFEPNEYGGFNTNCVANAADVLDLLQVMKAMLLDIGVDMEIRVMDLAALRSYTAAKKHDAMVLNARMALPFAPLQALQFRDYTSRPCLNFHNDDHFHRMLLDINSAATMTEAKVMFKEADRYNLEKHWSVYICPTVIPIAWQPYVKGYSGEHPNNGCGGLIPARLWINKSN